MKNKKRIVGIVMFFVVLLAMFAPIAQASNFIQSVPSGFYPVSSGAIYSYKGQGTPQLLQEDLAKFGVTVTDSTMVEIVPHSRENENAVLVVTEISENIMNKSAFIMMNSIGEVQPIIPSTTTTPRMSDGSEVRLNPLRDSFVLRICTQYNVYSNPIYQWNFIQPNALMFILYDDDNLYSITNVELEYWCTGTRYTCPGIEYVDENGEHCIALRVSNPVERRFYNSNNPYNSNYAINIMEGPICGQIVDYSFVANGRQVSERWEVRD